MTPCPWPRKPAGNSQAASLLFKDKFDHNQTPPHVILNLVQDPFLLS